MTKLTRSESEIATSESCGMTSSEDESTESSEDEIKPATPPPDLLGRSESMALLKCCLVDNYFPGKKSQTSSDLVGPWEDITGIKGSNRDQHKRSNPKRNKHTYNTKTDNSKYEYVFQHHTNVRDYIEKYRSEHTYGGVGGSKPQDSLIGSHTYDPYMAKLKNIRFWMDRYELIDTLTKGNTFNRSSKQDKGVNPAHVMQCKSPTRTDSRTLPFIRQTSSCPGSVGRTLLTVNQHEFDLPLHVQGSNKSPDHVIPDVTDSTNKCTFRRFKDFQALVDRTVKKSASKLEIVTANTENIPFANKNVNKKVSGVIEEPVIIADSGRDSSELDLTGYLPKPSNHTEKLDVNTSPISKSYIDFTKRHTESSNSLDANRLCLPVGVCDVYSTSTDSASLPTKYSSCGSNLPNYTPNPLYTPQKNHFNPKLKQKHACSRKVALQNGACRNENVHKTDTLKTRYAIQPS